MEEKDFKSFILEISRRLNEGERRIRLVEERIERIESSIASLEEKISALENNFRINCEMQASRTSEIKDKLRKIEVNLNKVLNELGKKANKTDLKQIETYIELLNPITSKFVTKDELKRELESIKEKA